MARAVDTLLWRSLSLEVVDVAAEQGWPEHWAGWLAAPARVTPRKGGVTIALYTSLPRDLQAMFSGHVFSRSREALEWLEYCAVSKEASAVEAGGEATATGRYRLDHARRARALARLVARFAHRLWPGEHP